MISTADLLKLKTLAKTACATADARDNEALALFCAELMGRSPLGGEYIEGAARAWCDGSLPQTLRYYRELIELIELMQRLDARQAKTELSELSIG